MLILASCGDNTSESTSPTSETPTSESTGSTPSSSGSETPSTTVNYGTEEAPLTVAEFNTEAAKLGLNNEEFSTEHFFVKGYVKSAPTYASAHSSYSFKLGNSKEDTSYINVGGAKRDESVDEPYQNDTVVVSGLAEFFNNYYAIYYTDDDSPAIKSVTRGTSTVTSTIKNGTISGLEATYANGATASFTVTVDTGYKISNVTANSKELTPTDGTYSFTVAGDTNVEVNIVDEASKAVTENIETKGTSFTLDSSNAKIATFTQGAVTITIDQNESNTATSQAISDSSHIRVYVSAKLKIAVTGGTLTKVTFTYVSGKELKSATCTNCTLVVDATTKNVTEVTADEGVSEISLIPAAQTRITAATVEYEPAA